MNIEFYTPYKKVSEKLVSEIKNEILGLSHLNKNISKAEVLLKEDEIIAEGENKICEIELTVYGGNLHIHTRSENFKKSAREAFKELKKIIKQQIKRQKMLPDEIVSTVSV